MILPFNATLRHQRPSVCANVRRYNLPPRVLARLPHKRFAITAQVRHQVVVKIVSVENEPDYQLSPERLLQLLHPQKFLNHAVAADTDWLDLLRAMKIGEKMPITDPVSGRKGITEHHHIAFG